MDTLKGCTCVFVISILSSIQCKLKQKSVKSRYSVDNSFLVKAGKLLKIGVVKKYRFHITNIQSAQFKIKQFCYSKC